MTAKRTRSLEDAVGKETYALWVDMLHRLVPEGRTHRLSVVVAAMLQYAYLIVTNNLDDDVELRGALRERGLRQAAKFRWETMARETMEVYRQIYLSEGVT